VGLASEDSEEVLVPVPANDREEVVVEVMPTADQRLLLRQSDIQAERERCVCRQVFEPVGHAAEEGVESDL
jgi:hypothetical protein